MRSPSKLRLVKPDAPNSLSVALMHFANPADADTQPSVEISKRTTTKPKKYLPTLALLLMASNNQDKGPTRRIITRLNLMFPRRSP